MTDPAIVQDGASQIGLGGFTPEMAGEEIKLKAQKELMKQAQSQATKRGEAEIMSQYGPILSKPYEEFKPTQETMSGFAALGSLLMVAGGMMGTGGKMAGIGAMNNIAGMLKGYQTGRQDLYEKERQQYESNMKAFEKNHALMKEAFDRALKMAPYNLTKAQNQLRTELTALGAKIPAAAVDKHGLIQTANDHSVYSANLDNQLRSLSQIDRHLTEIEVKKAVQSAQSSAKKEDVASQIQALDLQTKKQLRDRGGLTVQEKETKERRQQVADYIVKNKIVPTTQEEMAAVAEFHPDYKVEPTLDVGPFAQTMLSHQSSETREDTIKHLAGKKTLDVKERDRLDTAKVMIDDSERVARYIAENPDATGMLGQALGRSESVLGFFRGPPKTMDELQSKIDNGLDQIAKSDPSQRATAQKAAVLNKMLEALSLKDASATGRPTVFLERMISRWYKQGYPPDTLIDIIKERSGEADSVLSNYKLDTSRNAPDVNKQMYPLASSSVDDFLKQYRKAPAGAGLNELSSAQKTGIQERIDQVNNDTSLTAANKKDLKEKIKKQIADGKFSNSGLSWGD